MGRVLLRRRGQWLELRNVHLHLKQPINRPQVVIYVPNHEQRAAERTLARTCSGPHHASFSAMPRLR